MSTRDVFTAEGWVRLNAAGRVVEPPEPDEVDRCPGCDEPIDTGCPVSCPERALDDDADAWAESARG